MANKKVIALLAMLVSVPAGLTAQNPEAAAAQPQSGAPASQPVPPVSTPADTATREILSTVQGYGDQLKVPVLQAAGARYKIQIGDQVNVTFTLLKALNETVAVRPDGTVSLIGAPDIYVEHLTVPQLIDAIQKAYTGILHPPVMVTATLTNIEKPYFVVGGQVTNPGKFILHGPFTIGESIQAAGGFLLNTAKDSKVLLFRRTSNDWVECKLVDLKRVLQRGEIQDDVQLQSGDLVFVPKNRLAKVQPFISYFVVYNVFNLNYQTNYRIAGD